MKLTLLAAITGLYTLSPAATAQDLPPPTTLYLLPGTGADHRLFHQLDLSAYDAVYVRLPIAERRESMADYAQRIVRTQIDTTECFALLGVSLGGMVATEIAAAYPEQVERAVIVASAKTRLELPPTYRFGRHVPVYRLVGGRAMRWFTKQVQPRFEPMADAQRDLFIDMIYGKDPQFLQRAVGLMVRWEREEVPAGITHVHGTEDRTLPVEYVEADVTVQDEGHMLTYSRPEVVEGVLMNARMATVTERPN